MIHLLSLAFLVGLSAAPAADPSYDRCSETLSLAVQAHGRIQRLMERYIRGGELFELASLLRQRKNLREQLDKLERISLAQSDLAAEVREAERRLTRCEGNLATLRRGMEQHARNRQEIRRLGFYRLAHPSEAGDVERKRNGLIEKDQQEDYAETEHVLRDLRNDLDWFASNPIERTIAQARQVRTSPPPEPRRPNLPPINRPQNVSAGGFDFSRYPKVWFSHGVQEKIRRIDDAAYRKALEEFLRTLNRERSFTLEDHLRFKIKSVGSFTGYAIHPGQVIILDDENRIIDLRDDE